MAYGGYPWGVALAILQARTGSTRLPGKVLSPILGRPLLLRLIDRVSSARSLDGLVVATTVDEGDDGLASLLASEGVEVRRGSVDDVLARFLQVIDEFEPRTIVRLTGDNPLVDGATIERAVAKHLEAGVEYTSNGLSHRFPHGLNVEVVEASALRRLATLQLTAAEREHVTLGIVTRPKLFTRAAVTQDMDRSELRWTVDLPEDLAWARKVFEHLYPSDPDFGQEEVVGLIERIPALRRTMRDGG